MRLAQVRTQIRINNKCLRPLISDAYSAKNWRNRFIFRFKPTGGRPENFEENCEVHKISNDSAFDRYKIKAPSKLIYRSIGQAQINSLFVGFYYYDIALINLPIILLSGLFVFLTICGYYDLMDEHRCAVYWGKPNFLFGLSTLCYFKD